GCLAAQGGIPDEPAPAEGDEPHDNRYDNLPRLATRLPLTTRLAHRQLPLRYRAHGTNLWQYSDSYSYGEERRSPFPAAAPCQGRTHRPAHRKNASRQWHLEASVRARPLERTLVVVPAIAEAQGPADRPLPLGVTQPLLVNEPRVKLQTADHEQRLLLWENPPPLPVSSEVWDKM